MYALRKQRHAPEPHVPQIGNIFQFVIQNPMNDHITIPIYVKTI